MIKVYSVMIIWCLINFPFTFLFYYYNQSFLGSVLFLIGFLILCIVGLFKAHEIDKRRNRIKNDKK